MEHAEPASDAITIDDILELGRTNQWHRLGEIFATGKPLSPLEGRTRARYVMSFAGRIPLVPRAIDKLVGLGLRRWWRGHRFYDGGREGISSSGYGFRWVWRVMFPGYERPRVARGEEVFDFHVRTVPSTTDPNQLVSGLEWYGTDEKVKWQSMRALFHWIAWDLTRSELVELSPGGPIMARITWRVPGTSKWWLTSYYCHRWLAPSEIG